MISLNSEEYISEINDIYSQYFMQKGSSIYFISNCWSYSSLS